MGFFSRLFSQFQTPQVGQEAGSITPVPTGAHLSPQGFAVIDIETTGLSPHRDRVVEIAVVLTNPTGKKQSEWSTLVNPGIPMRGTEIHGITDADVAGAPSFSQIMDQLVPLLRGRAIVAHNAKFDINFLRSEFSAAGWSWPANVPELCTYESSRKYLPQLQQRTLKHCCKACGIHQWGAHRALGDATATAELLRHYLSGRTGIAPLKSHVNLPERAHKVQWPSQSGHQPSGSKRASGTSRGTNMSPTSRNLSQSPATNLLEQTAASEVTKRIVATGIAPAALLYVKEVLDALTDMVFTDAERAALENVASKLNLSDEETRTIKATIVQCMADYAADDNKFSNNERSEIKATLSLLGLDESRASRYFKEAQERRFIRLSSGLSPLPNNWRWGAPLKVGDHIVFSGGFGGRREALEEKAHLAGLYVGGNVAKKTVLFVTSGDGGEGKKAKALELGTRMADEKLFMHLLQHLQPFGA